MSNSQTLSQTYDVALLDLDGVVYIGTDPVAHAAQSLEMATTHGMRIGYVTNNASRTPDAVAHHLRSFGLQVVPDDVVTSAQAGARVLADHCAPGSEVLVVGGDGLELAVRQRGFIPTRTLRDDRMPDAVIQGFGPDTSWRNLADITAAVQRGVLWVATNRDLTVPTPRGMAPGNGSFVGIVEAVTGRSPVVAGKPEPPLMWESIARLSAARPLMVGDRLDTDIEGANRVGIDSLLVLTGVTTVTDLLSAPPELRPTYIAADLRGLVTALAGDGLDDIRQQCQRAWAGAKSI